MRRSHHNLIVTLGVLLGVLSCRNALATILFFETANPATGIVLGGLEDETAAGFGDYGDNVSSTTVVDAGPGLQDYLYGIGNGFTPGITVNYFHSGGGSGHSLHPPFAGFGWDDPVDYLHSGSTGNYWYVFTPSGELGVQVNSFDIDLWTGSGISVNWTLRQDTIGGAIITSGVVSGLSAGGNPDATVNIANGVYFGPTVLQITFNSAGNGNIGIDNLNFDQISVPEPCTGLLLGMGAIGMVIRTRRRRIEA